MAKIAKQWGGYEKVEGSGIWWIRYYVGGVRHREKVGTKANAIMLYQTRKADAIAGRKMPGLRNTRGVTISDLLDDMLEYVAHQKDLRNYKSRAEIVRAGIGDVVAADLLP